VSKEHVEHEQDDHIRLYLREIGQYKLLTKEEEVLLSQKIEKGATARKIIYQLIQLETALQKLREEPAPNLSNSANKREQTKVIAAIRSGIDEQQEAIQKLRNGQRYKRLGSDESLAQKSARKNGAVKTAKTASGVKAKNGSAKSPEDFALLRTELENLQKTSSNFLRRLNKECEEAETQFINSNLRLVVSIANTIETAHGRPASLEELADELNMDASKVSEALQFAGDPISLSEPLRENNDAKIGDIVEDTSVEAPDIAASKALMPKETEKMLSTLTEREQEILVMRFGISTGQPKTLEEVGEAMALTRERVRQIEARAMSKLRHPSSDLSTRDIFPF